MPGRGRPFPKGYSGKPKGAKNLATKALEIVHSVFDQLGGEKAFLEWIKKDEKNTAVFYKDIYPRVLPRNIEMEISGPEGPLAIEISARKVFEIEAKPEPKVFECKSEIEKAKTLENEDCKEIAGD